MESYGMRMAMDLELHHVSSSHAYDVTLVYQGMV